MKKQFEVIYKFSDVIDNIEAENEEEAKKLADERLESGHPNYDPTGDTRCYDVEVEEIKK